VFESAPPLFVSTRDRPTYEALHEWVPRAHSGIDSAFFLPEAYEPPRLRHPIIALAFDHFGEPRLEIDGDGPIEVEGQRYAPRFDRWADAAASKTKAHAMAYQSLRLHRFSSQSRPTELGGHTIVRPDHRTNPHLPFKIYQQPNSIASDEPWTYLAVYAGSLLTYSDRVHACVSTLAYGNPAMLHNPTTKRNALFESVGATSISAKPVTISQELRTNQLAETTRFVRESLADGGPSR
jgi:polysaccharide pyruvyl transferase WcaK-like protein